MANERDFVKAHLDDFPMPSMSDHSFSKDVEKRQNRKQDEDLVKCGETFTTQGVGKVTVEDCDNISPSVWNSCAGAAVAAAFQQAQAFCDGLRGCNTLYYKPSSAKWSIDCGNGRLIMTVTFEVQCR